jgi:hypothetical protein
MDNPSAVDQCILILRFDRALTPNIQAKDLRGAIAGRFTENDLFHQHSAAGKFIYRYPLIQYKIIQGNAIVVGLGRGALHIAKINLLNEKLEFGSRKFVITQQEMSLGKKYFGIREDKVKYCFLTPWLALNENNSRNYYKLADPLQRRHLLEKILIGNIISLSKGINYTIPSPIFVLIESLREISAHFKDVSMLGFIGVFKVNFALPDYWGIGKAVSRGFGTLKRLEDDHRELCHENIKPH